MLKVVEQYGINLCAEVGLPNVRQHSYLSRILRDLAALTPNFHIYVPYCENEYLAFSDSVV